jgi:hypothetical protein
MARWAPPLLAFLLAASGGCGDADRGGASGGGPTLGARGDAEVGGGVVSTVNGHPITLTEVERAARAAGVPPRLALRRLQDEALLAAAAAAAGAADRPEVRRAARRAMVQALLEREVEGRVTGASIDRAELEAAFEADLERWESPAQRRSVHVLARLPPEASAEAVAAAEAWIRDTHARLAAADEPAAAILALRRRPPEALPFEVTVEEVPPLERGAEADEAYLAAIFALDAEGLVPEPVRSSFGWHAIAVTEVTPAREVPREEAIETLRDERVAARRAERLRAWIPELAERHPVEVDRANVRRFLGDPSLWGDGT